MTRLAKQVSGIKTLDFTEERRTGKCTVIRQTNVLSHEPSSKSIPISSAPRSITASFCFCFPLVVAFDPVAELMIRGAVMTVFCDPLGALASGGETPVNLSIRSAGSLDKSSALALELELFVGLPSSAVLEMKELKEVKVSPRSTEGDGERDGIIEADGGTEGRTNGPAWGWCRGSRSRGSMFISTSSSMFILSSKSPRHSCSGPALFSLWVVASGDAGVETFCFGRNWTSLNAIRLEVVVTWVTPRFFWPLGVKDESAWINRGQWRGYVPMRRKVRTRPLSSEKINSEPSRLSCRPLKIVPDSWRNGVGVSRPWRPFSSAHTLGHAAGEKAYDKSISAWTGHERWLDAAQIQYDVFHLFFIVYVFLCCFCIRWWWIICFNFHLQCTLGFWGG